MFVSTMFYRRQTSSIGPLQFSDNSFHDSDVEVADQSLTPILMLLIILTTQIEVAKQVYYNSHIAARDQFADHVVYALVDVADQLLTPELAHCIRLLTSTSHTGAQAPRFITYLIVMDALIDCFRSLDGRRRGKQHDMTLV